MRTVNRFQSSKNPYKQAIIKHCVNQANEEKWRIAKVLQPLFPMRGRNMEFECITPLPPGLIGGLIKKSID